MHWQLCFADVLLERGGFDLILGNPPWLKVEWNESGVLGEFNPLFAIRNFSATELTEKRADAFVRHAGLRQAWTVELEEAEGVQSFLNAVQNYPLLQGMVIAAYFIASWRLGGQTLGMRPWRIRLVGQDGGAASWLQLVIRLVIAAAPLLVLGLAPLLGVRTTLWVLGLLWASWLVPALFDVRRRALHDFVAGTELRRIV